MLEMCKLYQVSDSNIDGQWHIGPSFWIPLGYILPQLTFISNKINTVI